MPAGEHIYGREDIWLYPAVAMYEWLHRRDSRSNTARTALAEHLRRRLPICAGKYDVDAGSNSTPLKWEPWTNNFTGWGRDLSLMPLEVAARTGLAGRLVDTAEQSYHAGELTAIASRIFSRTEDQLAGGCPGLFP